MTQNWIVASKIQVLRHSKSCQKWLKTCIMVTYLQIGPKSPKGLSNRILRNMTKFQFWPILMKFSTQKSNWTKLDSSRNRKIQKIVEINSVEVAQRWTIRNKVHDHRAGLSADFSCQQTRSFRGPWIIFEPITSGISIFGQYIEGSFCSMVFLVHGSFLGSWIKWPSNWRLQWNPKPTSMK